MQLEYVVKDNSYKTLKQIVKQEFKISARLTTKLKQNKQILLNETPIYLDKELSLNDKIRIILDFEEESKNIVPVQMKLDIIYEDDAILAINKPTNIATHPSNLHYNTSLANGVRKYYINTNLKSKIHLINRLDRGTSGIVLFAKNEYIQETIKNNHIHKEYIAILEGIVDKKSGRIDVPISRKPESIIERCVSKDGSKSITEYVVLQEKNNLSLVKFVLITGRTHQIRVHSQYIKHPILGDGLYGKTSELLNRMALHSHKVKFIHPITKKELELIAPIPKEFLKIFSK